MVGRAVLWCVFLACCISSHGNKFLDNQKDECEKRYLEPSQTPDTCSKFSSSSCLCNLNENCRYDDRTKMCVETPDCAKYKYDPIDCRRNGCFYDCGNQVCTSNEGSLPPTNCGDNEVCSIDCNDACACKGAGCEFDYSSKTCKNIRNFDCPEGFFSQQTCARLNGIYNTGRQFCRNKKEKGQCAVDHIVMAVNINGQQTTDTRGIIYTTGVHFEDIDKISIPFKHDLGITSDVFPDVSLYETGILGDPQKRDPSRCISFSIPLCQDGNYELTIKTLELFDVYQGEKLFNIKLGDHYIFPEIDLVKLSGGKFQPADLIVNFQVIGQILILEGEKSIKLNCGQISLSICYGLCTFTQGTFQISAISVIRYVDENPSKSSTCSKLHENDWECQMSNCRYNESTRTCLPIRQGVSSCKKDKICGFYDQAITYPCYYYSNLPLTETNCNYGKNDVKIQMAFAMDITNGDSIWKLTKNELPKIMQDIEARINNIHPDTEFALTVHYNWPSTAFIPANTDGASHGDAEGCYVQLQEFTKDVKKIIDQAQLIDGKQGPRSPAEATLPALAFATVDKKLGWTKGRFDSQGKRVFRFIVAVTDEDSIFHLGIPGGRKPFRLDGTDTCSTSLPPTFKLYKKIFFNKEINVIGMYGSPNLRKIYDDHFETIESSHCSGYYYSHSDFASKLPGLIESCVKENLQCICNKLDCIKP